MATDRAGPTAVDPSYWLGQLRRTFPDVGFVFTGPPHRRWIAVRGRSWTAVARDAIELYDRLVAAGLTGEKSRR